MSIDGIVKQLNECGIEAISRLPLKNYSSFRIGGEAELAIFPSDTSQIVEALKCLSAQGISYEAVGNGSNILFGDGLIKKALIFTNKMTAIETEEKESGGVLRALCGASLARLSLIAAENAWSGMEFARGIPGTLGGAVYMNAGAYGGAMSDVVIESKALNTNTLKTETVSEHQFGYRTGYYVKNRHMICLEATMRLTQGDRETIEARMREYSIARKEKQPLEYPSCGSYFKRPEGYFAGKLIEDCGLKGKRIGNAEVAKKHAGFIINVGNATASDVLKLEELVRETVYREFGVILEREVRVIQ